MTAPQHTAKPKADREDSGPIKNYKMQRCLFVGTGLLGSVGFVASHMSFAFAYAGGDFSLSDYVLDASVDAVSANYTTVDAAFTSSASTAESTALAQPITDTSIEASPTPSFSAPSTVAPSTPPAAIPQATTQPAPTAEPISAAATQPPPAPTPATGLTPHVSPVAPSTFTAVQPKTVRKVKLARSPLTGLLEAGAMASAVGVSATRGSEVSHEAAALAVETTASEAASLKPIPAVEPAAVPDILPAPMPATNGAASPIVEISPSASDEAAPIQATELVPAVLSEGMNLPEEYNSVFVDPTDYSIGATEAPDTGAPEIVVSEQSTGCEFTVGAGQAVPNDVCGATADGGAATPGAQPAPIAVNNSAPVAQAAPVASAPAVNVGPVSFSASGIRFSAPTPSTTAAGRDYLNRSVQPLVTLQAAQQFIFPLAIPSPITSLFGFRVHPITGEQRFHEGTDIGAAQGTPVLAAQDGVVESAGNAGGYGLMVELSHDLEEAQLRSRYAHLSEIFVEPGAAVKKGAVIGLVGSTGNSTGPHLHFEMMQATAEGWALVNADSLVQNSLSNLVKLLNDPMQAVSFNLSDFKLNGLNASNTTVQPGNLIDVPSPGQNGIPFRPAQPNAS